MFLLKIKMTDSEERVRIKVAIIADISIGKTTLLNYHTIFLHLF
jgi:hypothetical protein